MSIWTILFVVLLIAWISGFTVFHIAGGLIHLLLERVSKTPPKRNPEAGEIEEGAVSAE